MMPIKLNFGISDIFLSPRLALSGKKVWTLTIGNLIGYLSYITFSFISYEISYQNISKNFTDLGLFPILFHKDLSILSWFIYVIGIVLWIISYLFSSTTLSRITLNQLKGNNSFLIIDGLKFSFKSWKSILLSPLTIFFIITLFFFIGFLLSLLKTIPILGPISFSILIPIYFLGALFILYSVFCLLSSILYTPSIVSCYDEDVIGTVFQSYSITWSQPWRIIFYNIISLILMALGLEIMLWFFINAFNMVLFTFSYFMDETLINLIKISYDFFVSNENFKFILNLRDTITGSFISNFFNLPNFITDHTYADIKDFSIFDRICATFLSTFLIIIILFSISYAQSILIISLTLSFLIFKRLSDDDDIIKRLNQTENNEENSADNFFNFQSSENNV